MDEEVAAEHNKKAFKKNVATVQKNTGMQKTAESENMAKAKQESLKKQPGSAIRTDPEIKRMICTIMTIYRSSRRRWVQGFKYILYINSYALN